MSTGLTYLAVYTGEFTDVVNDATIVFNDYNEAMKYALWSAKFVYDNLGLGIGNIRWAIYTTGPNANGQVFYYDGAAVFSPFE